MPLAGLTTGIGHKLTFTDQNGLLQFVILESFTSHEMADVPTETDMDGNNRFPKFRRGWTGSFVVQRTNPVIDSYFNQQEANYYLGGDQNPVTITETIPEADGTFTQWQYVGCVLTLEDAGNYTGTDIVKQSVTFNASRKEQIT